MAIDNTPPRLQLIITIAAITVISLVGIDFVLRSYYGYMTDDAQRGKLARPVQLEDHHKAEKAALASAAMPLDQAVAQFAKGTRSELIAPKPSDDMGPMTGWSKLPKPAPTPEPKGPGATATPPIGDLHMATDGGAPHAPGADAGAHHPAAKDAGAPPKGAPHAPGAPHK